MTEYVPISDIATAVVEPEPEPGNLASLCGSTDNGGDAGTCEVDTLRNTCVGSCSDGTVSTDCWPTLRDGIVTDCVCPAQEPSCELFIDGISGEPRCGGTCSRFGDACSLKLAFGQPVCTCGAEGQTGDDGLPVSGCVADYLAQTCTGACPITLSSGEVANLASCQPEFFNGNLIACGCGGGTAELQAPGSLASPAQRRLQQTAEEFSLSSCTVTNATEVDFDSIARRLLRGERLAGLVPLKCEGTCTESGLPCTPQTTGGQVTGCMCPSDPAARSGDAQCTVDHLHNECIGGCSSQDNGPKSCLPVYADGRLRAGMCGTDPIDAASSSMPPSLRVILMAASLSVAVASAAWLDRASTRPRFAAKRHSPTAC